MDKKWLISISLKFILIFFLPYYLVTGPMPGYSSPLLNLGSANEVPSNPMQLSSIPLVLIFVVVLAVPAVIFDYVAKHRPVEQPIGKLFALVFVLMTPYGQELFMLLVYIILVTTGAGMTILINFVGYSLSIAAYADVWTMALMVVIPFFTREVRVLNLKGSGADTASRLKLSDALTRYNLLAIVFSVCLFLMPIGVISVTLQDMYSSTQQLYMVAGAGILQATPTRYSIAIAFTAVFLSRFPFLPVDAAFNVVYAHEVLRYLKSEVSRTRCLGVGLLATVTIPFIMFMFYQMPGTIVTVVPLPTIFALGLLVIWRIKPTEVTERIWRDEQDHIWYKDEGPMAEDEEVERIKVPLFYALRSKLERAGGKKTRYDWDHKAEDAFDGESDAEEH